MQRRIGTEVEIGKTVSPLDRIGASSAMDKTASNYLNAGEKVQKIRNLIQTGIYDVDIARYIPGTLELVFQGMLEVIDTKEQPAHSSYRDMENLDFPIMLTNNYYTNLNSMHICFPMNNFFAHFVKEISVTIYGNDKQLITTFLPYEIYQYSDSMLKHLPKDALKKVEKTMFYSKQAVYFNKTAIDRRIHNSNAANDITDLNINER